MKTTSLQELINQLTDIMNEYGEMSVYISKTGDDDYNDQWKHWQNWDSLEFKAGVAKDGNDKVCILHH